MKSESLSSNDSQRGSARHLERALRHVSDYWFPVNPVLLKKIKDGFLDGRYELDIDFLVEDLKADFSLFTYCLRELCRTAEAQENSPNPVSMMRNAGLPRLREILCVDQGKISRHATEGHHNSQLQCFETAMISASAAELLAEANGIESELGFATALLRQLGRTLIAWNYPTVYRRALHGAREGEDLDLTLSQALGFSPVLLAATLLRQWKGLSPALRLAVA
jgi:hypothetical protein